MEIYRGTYVWDIRYEPLSITCIIESFPEYEINHDLMVFHDDIYVQHVIGETDVYFKYYCWSYKKDKVKEWLEDQKKKAIQKRKEDILREFEDLANTPIIDRTHEE